MEVVGPRRTGLPVILSVALPVIRIPRCNWTSNWLGPSSGDLGTSNSRTKYGCSLPGSIKSLFPFSFGKPISRYCPFASVST